MKVSKVLREAAAAQPLSRLQLGMWHQMASTRPLLQGYLCGEFADSRGTRATSGEITSGD